MPPHLLLEGTVKATRLREQKSLSSDPSSILKAPFEETFSMHQLSLLRHQRQAQCQHPLQINNIPKMAEVYMESSRKAARRGATDSQIANRSAEASRTSLILTIFKIQVLASSLRRKRTKTRASTLITRRNAKQFKLPSRSYSGSPLTPLQQL